MKGRRASYSEAEGEDATFRLEAARSAPPREHRTLILCPVPRVLSLFKVQVNLHMVWCKEVLATPERTHRVFCAESPSAHGSLHGDSVGACRIQRYACPDTKSRQHAVVHSFPSAGFFCQNLYAGSLSLLKTISSHHPHRILPYLLLHLPLISISAFSSTFQVTTHAWWWTARLGRGRGNQNFRVLDALGAFSWEPRRA